MIYCKKGILLLFMLCLSWSAYSMNTIMHMKQKVDSIQNYRPLTQKKYDPWFGKDKIDHFLTSAFLVGFAYHSGREYFQYRHTSALNFSVNFSIGIGIGKEIWDKTSKKGTPSYRDLLADLAGVGLGFLIYSRAK